MKIEPIVVQVNANSQAPEIEKLLRDRFVRLGKENQGSTLRVAQLATYASGGNMGIVALVEIDEKSSCSSR